MEQCNLLGLSTLFWFLQLACFSLSRAQVYPSRGADFFLEVHSEKKKFEFWAENENRLYKKLGNFTNKTYMFKITHLKYDVIFMFPRVDLYNRISFSAQNSKYFAYSIVQNEFLEKSLL